MRNTNFRSIKIDQLDAASFEHHYVLDFNVSVYDSSEMHVGDCECELYENKPAL